MPSTSTVPPIHTGGDTPRARETDPDTSHAAADNSAKNLSRLQAIVLDLFREEADFFNDGLTDSELVHLFTEASKFAPEWPKIRPESARKRRSDIARLGYVRDSGVRRDNCHGSSEVVWVLS